MTRFLAICAVLVLGSVGAALSAGDGSLIMFDRDCSDFASQEQAQDFYELSKPGDPHGLDEDGNGVACEEMTRQ